MTATASSLPWRRLALLLLLTLLSLGLAIYIRYGLVQVTRIGLACDAGEVSFACWLRQGAIALFSRDIPGWVALVAGAVTLLRPCWWGAALTLLAGSLGLILYDTELAATGLTLLALVPARLQRAPARA